MNTNDEAIRKPIPAPKRQDPPLSRSEEPVRRPIVIEKRPDPVLSSQPYVPMLGTMVERKSK